MAAANFTQEELVEKIEEKLVVANKLTKVINDNFTEIPGIYRILRKVQQEIKFLKNITAKNAIKSTHITSSNLVHYEFLLETLKLQRDVVAIDCVFRLESRTNPLRVDIVGDNGLKWIKVIARNSKSIRDAIEGHVHCGTRSVLDQAHDYLEASALHPCLFQRPKIFFYFANQLEPELDLKLRTLDIVPTTLNDQDDSHEFNVLTETLNLDITTMLAYVSNVTNGGANFKFKEPLLTAQAERERDSPIKPILDKIFEGRRLICCQLAYSSFYNIIASFAGPNEYVRFKQFKKRIEIVADIQDIPKELAKLALSAKVNQRNLKIFGFGIAMKAMTVTSNKAFVQSAKMQGVNVPSFMHASRALTEAKEARGTPI